MHLKRWITGLTALPFLFLLISKGGTQLFALVVSIVSTIALWEYFHLVSKTDENARPAFTEGSKVAKKKNSPSGFQFLSFLTGFAMIWAAYMLSFKLMVGLITWNFLLSGF
ncbi:MAG: hypothetical protein QGI64_00320, partial [Desulfobacterales bacterium]|nr:hypothetical protein [Desulfobacterales bacterium]